MAELSKPDVLVDFLFEKGLLFILIKNHSDAAAMNVRVRFDKEFNGVGGRVPISKLNIFQHLQYLAPRKEIKIFLDVATNYFTRINPVKLADKKKTPAGPEPTSLNVHISWVDEQLATHERKIHHNLIIYKDLGYIPQIEQL